MGPSQSVRSAAPAAGTSTILAPRPGGPAAPVAPVAPVSPGLPR